MTGRGRQAQGFAPFGFPAELRLEEALIGCGLSRVPAFAPVHPLDSEASTLGMHAATPLRGWGIQGEAMGLADENGEAPPGKIAAPALAEFSQPRIGPLACRPVKIPEVAIRVAALVLLEPGDSRTHGPKTGTASHREQVVSTALAPCYRSV
jgi:hypothetical protein